MAQLSTDPTVLAKAAANFERIADELKSEVGRVQSTATGLNQQWKGTAAEAAQQAMRRFDAAASAHVAQLNDISTNVATAGVRYSAADEEQARRLASNMGLDGEDKEHNGAQLVDWKQGPDQPMPPPAPGLPPEGVRPPVAGNLTQGPASRPSEQAKGGMSLWDQKGGEWRYDPGSDKWHNPHWDYNPHDTKFPEWQNIRIGELPPHTDEAAPPRSGSRAPAPTPNAPPESPPSAEPRAPAERAPVEPPATRPAPPRPGFGGFGGGSIGGGGGGPLPGQHGNIEEPTL